MKKKNNCVKILIGDEVMEIYKCFKCQNMFELLEGNINNIKCCNETPILIKENTSDGAIEKHVPYCIIEDDLVIVKVGEVPHPMEKDHYIEWISAEYSDSTIKYHLKPSMEPNVTFDYEPGMTIYAYCNKHGLWKKTI